MNIKAHSHERPLTTLLRKPFNTTNMNANPGMSLRQVLRMPCIMFTDTPSPKHIAGTENGLATKSLADLIRCIVPPLVNRLYELIIKRTQESFSLVKQGNPPQ